MTLIELLWFIVAVATGLGVADAAGHRFGIIGYVGGFLAGVVAGWGVLVVVFGSLGLILDFLWVGIPVRPRCRNGTCSKADYELTKELTWRCKCGLRYEKQWRRFLELEAEGNRLPYLKWARFKGWVPDS